MENLIFQFTDEREKDEPLVLLELKLSRRAK